MDRTGEKLTKTSLWTPHGQGILKMRARHQREVK